MLYYHVLNSAMYKNIRDNMTNIKTSKILANFWFSAWEFITYPILTVVARDFTLSFAFGCIFTFLKKKFNKNVRRSTTNIGIEWVFAKFSVGSIQEIIFFYILGQNTKRQSGRKVQLENINAGKVSQMCFTSFFVQFEKMLELKNCIRSKFYI